MESNNKASSLSKNWKAVNTQYKLLNIVGEGAFGKVVRAKDRHTQQQVAIKFIKVDFSSYTNCLYLFRELSIMRQLKHMTNNVFTC